MLTKDETSSTLGYAHIIFVALGVSRGIISL